MKDNDVLDAIKERIFQFIEDQGLSNADFAASIDIGSAVVSHMKNGRNKVSLNVYAKILNSFPILNPDWLLFGEGVMYRNESIDSVQSTNFQPNLFTPTTKKIETEALKSTPNPVEQPELIRASRQVKKIMIFYDDNSFQELIP